MSRSSAHNRIYPSIRCTPTTTVTKPHIILAMLIASTTWFRSTHAQKNQPARIGRAHHPSSMAGRSQIDVNLCTVCVCFATTPPRTAGKHAMSVCSGPTSNLAIQITDFFASLRVLKPMCFFQICLLSVMLLWESDIKVLHGQTIQNILMCADERYHASHVYVQFNACLCVWKPCGVCLCVMVLVPRAQH